MSVIKDSHRLFLRTLMSRQFMKEEEIKEIYRQACEAYEEENSSGQFQGFINVVNKSLRSLFLEIRQAISEEDGTVYYGLVNNTEDEHSKLATDYSANDIAFFKKAMDLIIIGSDDGSVSSMDLVNAAADLEKRMTYTYTEMLLKRLVNDKWMDESSGIYCLGGRAMLELQPYLKKVYEDDIIDCMICKSIAIKLFLFWNSPKEMHPNCVVSVLSARHVHSVVANCINTVQGSTSQEGPNANVQTPTVEHRGLMMYLLLCKHKLEVHMMVQANLDQQQGNLSHLHLDVHKEELGSLFHKTHSQS